MLAHALSDPGRSGPMSMSPFADIIFGPSADLKPITLTEGQKPEVPVSCCDELNKLVYPPPPYDVRAVPTVISAGDAAEGDPPNLGVFEISWQAASDGAAHSLPFLWLVQAMPVTTPSAPVVARPFLGAELRSATLTNLPLGVPYVFAVSAINRHGSSPSSAPTAPVVAPLPGHPIPLLAGRQLGALSPTRVLPLPEVPSGVVAVPYCNGVRVTWTVAPGTAPPVVWIIHVEPVSSPPAQNAVDVRGRTVVVRGTVPVRQAYIRGLVNGVAYAATVTGLNRVGLGSPSAPSPAVRPDVSLRPLPEDISGGSYRYDTSEGSGFDGIPGFFLEPDVDESGHLGRRSTHSTATTVRNQGSAEGDILSEGEADLVSSKNSSCPSECSFPEKHASRCSLPSAPSSSRDDGPYTDFRRASDLSLRAPGLRAPTADPRVRPSVAAAVVPGGPAGRTTSSSVSTMSRPASVRAGAVAAERPDRYGPSHYSTVDDYRVILNQFGLSMEGAPNLSAMHLAAMVDSAPCIRALAAVGHPLDCRATGAATPLHLAASVGAADAVAALLECGATATAIGAENSTALHIAACGGFESVVRLLLPYSGLLDRDSAGATPSDVAAASGHHQIAAILGEALRRRAAGL